MYVYLVHTYVHVYYIIYIHTYILNGILTSTDRPKRSNPPRSLTHAWNRSVPASPNGHGHRREAYPVAGTSGDQLGNHQFQLRIR